MSARDFNKFETQLLRDAMQRLLDSGMSQAQVAKLVGYQQQGSVSSFIGKHQGISYKRATRLAEASKTTLEKLLGGAPSTRSHAIEAAFSFAEANGVDPAVLAEYEATIVGNLTPAELWDEIRVFAARRRRLR